MTSSGASFTANMAGAIIRFSTGSTAPTAPEGSIEPDPEGTDNPYFAQRVIASVDSATTLTLDAAVSSSTTLTGVKYQISDPIDIEPFAMLSLFERMVEREFARGIRAEDLSRRETYVRDALIRAAGADHRNVDLGGSSRSWIPTKLSDIAIIQ